MSRLVMSAGVGLAVAGLCTAATFGAGTVLCGALGEAAGSALDAYLTCPPEQSGAACAQTGAITGLAAGWAFGHAGTSVIKHVAAGAGAGAFGSIVGQRLTTGQVDWGQVAEAAMVGGAIGGGAGVISARAQRRATAPVHRPAPTVAPADGEPVLFGQARIGPNFSTKADVPVHLRGRPIADVSAELRAGTMLPDAIPITAFEHGGRLVTVNNRGLAALSDAGFAPTNLSIVDKGSLPPHVLARLDEVRQPWGRRCRRRASR